MLRRGFFFLVFLALSSCSLSAQQIEYERAEKAERDKRYPEAVQHYKNVVDRYVKSDLALKSAERAGRVSLYELHSDKDRFTKAIQFFKHIVLYSPDQKARIEAQQKIAEINFSQLMNYNQAVIEYSRLLELPHSPIEGFNYRLSIARSYYYLSNFFQALVEIDLLLKKGYDKSLLFDALLLKANIYLTNKQLDEAIDVLKRLLDEYPERSKSETIGLVLALCYEEQKNFPKAIETLESIKEYYPRKQFIENRIKTLKERQTYLPGAKGLKK